ncbi:MAG TPA: uracil-DNA glycosylase [Vicinamibacterales bacterium]|nr:uracil-DNA glycosylase [Vicinamibacterales bacterium]
MTNPDLSEHLRWAETLGVTGFSRDPKWRTRAAEAGAASSGPARSVTADPPATGNRLPSSALRASEGRPATDLASIRSDLGDCTRCKLYALGRKQIVFGEGNPDADLMFIGEAPGADEDAQGVPFIGRAGQLLTRIIEAIGLTREQVYIANVIKCRPPGNRNPEPDEIAECEPFLLRQIESVRPKVIVALGTFAAHTLLRTDAPISRLRGTFHEYHGAKLLPTFHPAYLLRSPERKRDVWDDMKKVRAVLAGEA